MKIPPKRISSDDCVVYVGRKIEGDKIVCQGVPYKVHEGEWVEVIPVTSIGEAIAISRMMGADLKQTSKIAEGLNQICEGLAKRITDWDWTDMEGKPLPNPHDDPDVIKLLTEDEIIWLALAAQIESPGERKNE